MNSLANKDIIRRVRFAPYRKGLGPTFTLTMWDCQRAYRGGPQWQIGYRLVMRQQGKAPVVVFEAEDYGCSPCHGIDSKESIAALMGFLTLRRGDTDSEYFEGYTQAQLDFAEQYAESLSAEVYFRFGDNN